MVWKGLLYACICAIIHISNGQFDFYNGFGGSMGMGGGQGGRGGAPGTPPMSPMSGLGPMGWMFGGMFGGGEAAEGGGGMFGMPGMPGMFGGRFGNPYSRSLGGLSFGLPGGNMFPATSPAPPTPQPHIPVRGAFDSMLPNTKTFDNPGSGGFGTTQSPETALNFGVSTFTGARKCMKPSFLNQCSCARACGSGTVDYGLCEDQPGVQQNPNTPAFCCPESVHMMCLSGSGGCSGMSYVMDICDPAEITEDDHIEEWQEQGVKCVIDPKSLLYLFGLQLDYSNELIGGGFNFMNPNAETTCGCGKSFNV